MTALKDSMLSSVVQRVRLFVVVVTVMGLVQYLL